MKKHRTITISLLVLLIFLMNATWLNHQGYADDIGAFYWHVGKNESSGSIGHEEWNQSNDGRFWSGLLLTIRMRQSVQTEVRRGFLKQYGSSWRIYFDKNEKAEIVGDVTGDGATVRVYGFRTQPGAMILNAQNPYQSGTSFWEFTKENFSIDGSKPSRMNVKTINNKPVISLYFESSTEGVQPPPPVIKGKEREKVPAPLPETQNVPTAFLGKKVPVELLNENGVIVWQDFWKDPKMGALLLPAIKWSKIRVITPLGVVETTKTQNTLYLMPDDCFKDFTIKINPKKDVTLTLHYTGAADDLVYWTTVTNASGETTIKVPKLANMTNDWYLETSKEGFQNWYYNDFELTKSEIFCDFLSTYKKELKHDPIRIKTEPFVNITIIQKRIDGENVLLQKRTETNGLIALPYSYRWIDNVIVKFQKQGCKSIAYNLKDLLKRHQVINLPSANIKAVAVKNIVLPHPKTYSFIEGVAPENFILVFKDISGNNLFKAPMTMAKYVPINASKYNMSLPSYKDILFFEEQYVSSVQKTENIEVVPHKMRKTFKIDIENVSVESASLLIDRDEITMAHNITGQFDAPIDFSYSLLNRDFLKKECTLCVPGFNPQTLVLNPPRISRDMELQQVRLSPIMPEVIIVIARNPLSGREDFFTMSLNAVGKVVGKAKKTNPSVYIGIGNYGKFTMKDNIEDIRKFAINQGSTSIKILAEIRDAERHFASPPNTCGVCPPKRIVYMGDGLPDKEIDPMGDMKPLNDDLERIIITSKSDEAWEGWQSNWCQVEDSENCQYILEKILRGGKLES